MLRWQSGKPDLIIVPGADVEFEYAIDVVACGKPPSCGATDLEESRWLVSIIDVLDCWVCGERVIRDQVDQFLWKLLYQIT